MKLAITLALIAAAAASAMGQAVGTLPAQPQPPDAPKPAPPAAPADPNFSPGRTVNYNWTLNDAADYRWDIVQGGYVNDGLNDAYDGGMKLLVGGSAFAYSNPARLHKDGREIEIGPWMYSTVEVRRRIRVDAKIGYARWIDVFTNTGDQPVVMPLQYRSNFGNSIRQETKLTGGIVGVVTSDGSGSRPAVAQIVGTGHARLRFTTNRQGSDEVHYAAGISLSPGKTAALCFIHVQRRGHSDAARVAQSLDMDEVLADLPLALRGALVNVSTSVTKIGPLKFLRDEQSDVIVTLDGTRLIGEILNESFELTAADGPTTLPADSVIGLSVLDRADPQVHVALTDGQILAGRLTNGPLRFKPTDGDELAFTPRRLATAAFAISQARPKDIPLNGAMLELIGGQRLTFDAMEPTPLPFRTACGELAVTGEIAARVDFLTADGGLHRVSFRNGSVLSGMAGPNTLTFHLTGDKMITVSAAAIGSIVFPHAELPATVGPVRVSLRNGNVVIGTIVDEQFTLETKQGAVAIASATLAALTTEVDALPTRATVKLADGSTLSGRLAEQPVNIKVSENVVVPVFASHIESIVVQR
ncbi:MAG: hypothetical protein ACYS8X_10760 [Planctomycetota bacterium]|jgi:small nuclear ribonucleoprotein (snRNP)-like protein